MLNNDVADQLKVRIMKILMYLILFLMLSVAIAQADCVYNGASYPEGTILGPYICTNGQWVFR